MIVSIQRPAVAPKEKQLALIRMNTRTLVRDAEADNAFARDTLLIGRWVISDLHTYDRKQGIMDFADWAIRDDGSYRRDVTKEDMDSLPEKARETIEALAKVLATADNPDNAMTRRKAMKVIGAGTMGAVFGGAMSGGITAVISPNAWEQRLKDIENLGAIGALAGGLRGVLEETKKLPDKNKIEPYKKLALERAVEVLAASVQRLEQRDRGSIEI